MRNGEKNDAERIGMPRAIPITKQDNVAPWFEKFKHSRKDFY